MKTVIFLLLLILTAPFVTGFTVKHLWEWFVVATFHVQPLSTAAAYGLSLFVYYFKTGMTTDHPEGQNRAAFDVGLLLVGSGITLVAGWFVHTYWMQS